MRIKFFREIRVNFPFRFLNCGFQNNLLFIMGSHKYKGRILCVTLILSLFINRKMLMTWLAIKGA